MAAKVAIIVGAGSKWDKDGNPAGNCASGHLDFDVYPDNHDVSFLGVQNLTWRAAGLHAELRVDAPGALAADRPLSMVLAVRPLEGGGDHHGGPRSDQRRRRAALSVPPARALEWVKYVC